MDAIADFKYFESLKTGIATVTFGMICPLDSSGSHYGDQCSDSPVSMCKGISISLYEDTNNLYRHLIARSINRVSSP